MSRENVELVHKAFDAFNRRDVDGLLKHLDAGIEWIPFRSALEGTTYRGHEGVRQNLVETFEDWECVRMDPYEVREVGDQLVVLGRIAAKVKDGPSAEVRVAWLVRLRGDKAIRFEVCLDQQQALEAVGLRE